MSICYRIPNKNIKKKVFDNTRDLCDMYYLEQVFGIACNGHGAGCGGEDISFIINKEYIDITNTGRGFTITAYGSMESDTIGAIQASPKTLKILEKKLCVTGYKLTPKKG